MAKEQTKIQVVYLHETVQNPGIQGKKTLSTKDTPGLEFEMLGEYAIKYTLKGCPSGVIYHPKSVVFEK